MLRKLNYLNGKEIAKGNEENTNNTTSFSKTIIHQSLPSITRDKSSFGF